jgi:hypothetical protein
MNDGGTIDDIKTFYWLTRGMTATSRVMIEFSPDGGLSWSNVASDIPALTGTYDFSPCATFSPTPIGRWRIVNQGNTNIWDASETNFILRCGPINYYVNDTSTSGDVYCTAAGSTTNTGLDPASPLLYIQSVVDLYDLAQGDRIFVDTGYYD